MIEEDLGGTIKVTVAVNTIGVCDGADAGVGVVDGVSSAVTI